MNLPNKKVPSKSEYVSMILDIVMKYRTKIQSAPERKGWDPVFKKRIAAKWTVKSERNANIRELSEEAMLFGYDMSDCFASFATLTEEVDPS